MIINPFEEKYLTESEDIELSAKAVRGDKNSLEELILRHQAWIFNIVQRMVWHPQDAEDITQEILIKIITRLSSFKGKSSFRTWLYRVVANHVIDMKRSKYEKHIKSFEDYGRGIDETPDFAPPDAKNLPVELNLIIEETKVGCLAGMLLCLDRKTRLVFILGAIFGVKAIIGSEILEISKDNFRQILSRGRKKVANFMDERCSLVKVGNSCVCARKTTALMEEKIIDADNLLFAAKKVDRIRNVVKSGLREVDDLLRDKSVELFRDDPFHESPDFAGKLQKILNSREFKGAFFLN